MKEKKPAKSKKEEKEKLPTQIRLHENELTL